MINRSFTRTVLNGAESTAQTKSLASDSLPFALTTADHFYLGAKQPFAIRYFLMAVPNTVAALVSVEYWNGSDWVKASDVFDETDGFRKSGFISWKNPGDWQASVMEPIHAGQPVHLADSELKYFWLRLMVNADLSGGTALQSVVNLFCSDDLFRAYYPNIANDSRYLPEGRTDFLEQYQAAKDLVVSRLKQASKIGDEGDIIDVNAVCIAAVHATAYVILHPLKGSEEVRQAARDAYQAMQSELERALVPTDQNKDGRISEDEKPSGSKWLNR